MLIYFQVNVNAFDFEDFTFIIIILKRLKYKIFEPFLKKPN